MAGTPGILRLEFRDGDRFARGPGDGVDWNGKFAFYLAISINL